MLYLSLYFKHISNTTMSCLIEFVQQETGSRLDFFAEAVIVVATQAMETAQDLLTYLILINRKSALLEELHHQHSGSIDY